MITRIVKVKLKEEFRETFLEYMKKFAADTCAFKNSHHVDYFADMDEPNNFHIYTIWKTEGALNKFRKSDINIKFKSNLNTWCTLNYVAWTVQNVQSLDEKE